jgi:hypothetical protein
MTQDLRAAKLKLTKGLLLGFVMIVVVIWAWVRLTGNPIKDLRLIVSGEIVKGYVTNAQEIPIEYETNNGTKEGFQAVCKYYFTTIEGIKVVDSTALGGEMPDYLKGVERNPYQVEVQYLPSNPKNHKIRDFDFMDLREWFIKKVLVGGVLLVVFLSLGFSVIRSSIKEFKQDIRN